MEGVNLLHLVYNDTFCDIQKYLDIKDLFNLRCTCVTFRDYIDVELSKLKKMILPKSHESIMTSFEVMCDKCSSLKVLNLNHNDWLTDEILSKILRKNSKTLKSLSLNSCNNLSSVGLQPAIIDCKQLRKLSLHSCYWLTVGCIEAIAFHHENLEDLDLSSCLISERCLVILLNKFRNLKVLSLSSIATVNDNVLFNISMFLNVIRHLNLFGCLSITDRGVGALSLNCKNLESLSVRGCINVSERSLNLLRNRNVHIDVPRNSIQSYMQHIRRQQIHHVRIFPLYFQ
jgi:hypothetical protein